MALLRTVLILGALPLGVHRACGGWPARSARAGPASSPSSSTPACRSASTPSPQGRWTGLVHVRPRAVDAEPAAQGVGAGAVRLDRRRSRAGRAPIGRSSSGSCCWASSPRWPPCSCRSPSSSCPAMALAFVVGGLLVGEVRGAGRLLGVGLRRDADRASCCTCRGASACSPVAGRRSWARPRDGGRPLVARRHLPLRDRPVRRRRRSAGCSCPIGRAGRCSSAAGGASAGPPAAGWSCSPASAWCSSAPQGWLPGSLPAPEVLLAPAAVGARPGGRAWAWPPSRSTSPTTTSAGARSRRCWPAPPCSSACCRPWPRHRRALGHARPATSTGRCATSTTKHGNGADPPGAVAGRRRPAARPRAGRSTRPRRAISARARCSPTPPPSNGMPRRVRRARPAPTRARPRSWPTTLAVAAAGRHQPPRRAARPDGHPLRRGARGQRPPARSRPAPTVDADRRCSPCSTPSSTCPTSTWPGGVVVYRNAACGPERAQLPAGTEFPVGGGRPVDADRARPRRCAHRACPTTTATSRSPGRSTRPATVYLAEASSAPLAPAGRRPHGRPPGGPRLVERVHRGRRGLGHARATRHAW